MSRWTEGSNKKQMYVSGLPKDVTEKELVEKFGQVGPIAKDPKRAYHQPGAKKVWLYTDRATGKPKGDHGLASMSTVVSWCQPGRCYKCLLVRKLYSRSCIRPPACTTRY